MATLKKKPKVAAKPERKAKAKAKPARKVLGKKPGKGKAEAPASAKRAMPDPPAIEPGKSGPRLEAWQREALVMLLASGQQERLINDYFQLLGWGGLSSSTISYYREQYRALIEEAARQRTDLALTAGLALKAERVAALKDHAAMLEAIRFVPGKTGRLFNEKAWRETIEDIALEMGERKPKEGVVGEQTIKVLIGIDPEKV